MYKYFFLCAKLIRKGDIILTVNVLNRNNILLVRLKGELTKDTVYKLDKKVTKKVEGNECYNLVINVSNLKFIDYKGINKLLYNYEIVKKNKGKVLLCGNNLNIGKRLKRSRLLNYIYEFNDELCCCKYLNKG